MKAPKFNIGDIVVLKIPALHYAVYTTITEIKVYSDGETRYYTAFDDNPVDEQFISLAKTDVKNPEPTYPKCWADVKEFVSNRPSDNILTRWAEICNLIEITEDYATAEYWKHIYFMQLILLRDIYRQGWGPVWTNKKASKYSIVVLEDEITTVSGVYANRVLSFQSAAIRDLFLENFKDLINECKEFI
ncbi:MAG: hypothetical protein IJ759_00125 [Bacteroidales bacterium]|nr:hypothetical protein [Bacteroidales bacterium]